MNLFKKTINNQSGAMTLLVVVMTSICMITLLSTTYIYTVNRSKYHSRIRQAYAMQNVMEEAAKRMRQFYDSNPASGGWPVNDECAIGKQSLKITGPDGKSYCFGMNKMSDPSGGTIYAMHGQIKSEGESSLPSDFSYVEKFVARLDSFFDDSKAKSKPIMNGEDPRSYFNKPTMVGWLFKPTEAVAGYDYLGDLNHSPDEGGDKSGDDGSGGIVVEPPGPGPQNSCSCMGNEADCYGVVGSDHEPVPACGQFSGMKINRQCISISSYRDCAAYEHVYQFVSSAGTKTKGEDYGAETCTQGQSGYAACMAVCAEIRGCMVTASPTPGPSGTPPQVDPSGWGTGMNSCSQIGGSGWANCSTNPNAPNCLVGCMKCTVGECASISMDIVNAEGKRIWTSTQAFKFVKPGDFRTR